MNDLLYLERVPCFVTSDSRLTNFGIVSRQHPTLGAVCCTRLQILSVVHKLVCCLQRSTALVPPPSAGICDTTCCAAPERLLQPLQSRTDSSVRDLVQLKWSVRVDSQEWIHSTGTIDCAASGLCRWRSLVGRFYPGKLRPYKASSSASQCIIIWTLMCKHTASACALPYSASQRYYYAVCNLCCL